MKVIGITGSSGSGKTTICERLNQREDTKIIDVDKIAKRLTNSETEYFLEVKNAFQNDNILLENGNLDRPKLANLIYHDNQKLQKLNEITFKHLIPQIMKEINCVKQNIKIVIIDAPLLFEAGLDQYCDITIALEASNSLKIQRICKRDNISEEVAKARLEIQQSNEFYRQKADYIIENDENTTIVELEQQLEKMIKNNFRKDQT